MTVSRFHRNMYFRQMKFLRKLLFPFSLIYGGITYLRNRLYDMGWLKSHSYIIPIICVGNLSTGGTGKSPMAEFLVSRLKDRYTLSVLSRGYKRKTKGFQEVFENSTVAEVGDEPLQFKRKFPEVKVAVCERRSDGIEKLLPSSELIVLDDAFQHRKVNPSFSILLTSYGDLYVNDLVLPAGNLREPKTGADRADILVVTKCPATLSQSEMDSIKIKLRPKPHQHIHFTKIVYSEQIENRSEKQSLRTLKNKNFTLVTGIANPKPLVEFLKNHDLQFVHKSFSDHHHFTDSEIKDLDQEGIILTTEKDYMRLQPFIKNVRLFYLPITISFLNDTADEFIRKIETSPFIQMK